jgi:hypothetical protein
MKEQRPGYGDAEAKRIIQRAAEIDAEQGRQLDAPALREIAAEAGISPLALDRALQEHESTAVNPRGSWVSRHRALVTVAAVVVAMFVFFAFARMMPPTR